MSYVPTFKCKKCGNEIRAEVSGDIALGGLVQGFLPACSCESAAKDWEQAHRISIENRKKKRRG